MDVDNVFKYHPPKGDQAERYTRLRDAAKEFALCVKALTPGSREQSLALTSIQQATMWANAAIAINESNN